MELKEYQQKTLDLVSSYLQALDVWREKNAKVIDAVGEEASIDFPLKAWEKIGGKNYKSRRNAINEYFPNFCLKIPTGGGKTFLAVKIIDLINSNYLKKRTGLILWVVPTTQIYRQTIHNLRNREHPYRQFLDIASGGRTMVIEKMDHFTPLDTNENLVILMLMLPSAARQTKETLKVFRDRGGFSEFFPAEDDGASQRKLIEIFPNLDKFGKEESFLGPQIKTSLGNVLRMLSPLVILDEGHKAYSENAQSTLRGFNPSLILELSATPTSESNVLIDIKGVELNREEMIKLDLHIVNKASMDWKDTLLASVEKRNYLEIKAREYEANTGVFIRPICLIQVERTGKEQRGGRYIHAEDAKEWLTKVAGISEDQVAIKTSEKDDIEGIDLLSNDCQIRYIITKQALQEGWDCPFVYVLTVLTNPTSKTALTQLIGRILRQPFARKTKIKDLDESYVFVFQQRGVQLLSEIRAGFEQEGLGDLAGQVITDEATNGDQVSKERTIELRDKFKKFAGKIFLPVFVINDKSGTRQVNYEMDILSRIDWSEVVLTPLYKLHLLQTEDKDFETLVGLSDDEREVLKQRGKLQLKNGGLEWDEVFITRHLSDVVPNPWTAFEIGKQVFNELRKLHDESLIVNNLVFIMEEVKKQVIRESERLAEEVFRKLVKEEVIRFLIIRDGEGYKLPSTMKVKSTSKPLTKADWSVLQLSLFEFVPEEDFNETEKTVAWYLEDQGRLLWWYRNISRQDYFIQGWRKNRIYPDFIVSDDNGKDDYDRVFVVETKGLHLKNEDTAYKQEVFDLCNKVAEAKSMGELGLSFDDKKVRFEVVFEDEWQRKLNEMISMK